MSRGCLQFFLQELSQLKTRSVLELQAREAEIQDLKQQLQRHEEHRYAHMPGLQGKLQCLLLNNIRHLVQFQGISWQAL